MIYDWYDQSWSLIVRNEIVVSEKGFWDDAKLNRMRISLGGNSHIPFSIPIKFWEGYVR